MLRIRKIMMTETSNINVPPSKLIVDIKNEKVLPKRFRTMLDEVDKSKTMPNLKGFRELNMSGSGVFSQKGLQKVKETINSDNIIVVDTRKESHGYVNGMPITWY